MNGLHNFSLNHRECKQSGSEPKLNLNNFPKKPVPCHPNLFHSKAEPKLNLCSIAFRRGKGGIKLTGEFRKSLQSSMDCKPKQPNFMEKTQRFGSIGWGVQRDNSFCKHSHNKSESLVNNSNVPAPLLLGQSY